ncbi:hypothetical protein HHK36_003535 [Tetracentron sinense]|uniref:FCP1 homology domain-containing protein n=1 Tax=Tetracentron sinense TaxID=13715 RepID=A0A834ZPG3_TETSI|nr:hypothetical protein HHK36_003535 [Tetracentron sinense]
MPALKMKTKLSTGCLREGNGLHICRKSSKISKNSCSQVRVCQQIAELDTAKSAIQNCQDVSSNIEESTQEIKHDEAIDHQELLDGETLQFQKWASSLVDSAFVGRMLHSMSSKFYPVVGSDNDPDVPHLTVDDGDDGRSSSSNYQTCNVSDSFISDMSIAVLPFDEYTGLDDITETSPFPDYEFAEPNMMFDMAERYMTLPFLEETVEIISTNVESYDEAMMKPDESCLYLAVHKMESCNQEPDFNAHSIDLDEADCFDPQLFFRNLPDQSDAVPNFQQILLPKETQKRKHITLVLDLDETLVHSTLEHCDDADFSFPVFFNMKEHTVYVRQRPYLHRFLEKVAEMFDVTVFTASQRTYAEQLLNILDPDKKFISQCASRESCIFSDGSYTKDLTVLGVDLAKVAIIDNSPQVFQLQVNNGIPIKSWFDDPSDRALISLLPFLETLVDADDVRPIIAKRFNNKK